MSTYQGTAYSTHDVAHVGARIQRVLLVIVAAAAFAGLTSAYFFAHAGESYPEPWTQVTD